MTKNEFRTEKEKLKKMNPKDRGWYIWNYYRVPILIGLAAVFLLYQAGGAFLRSRQDCMLYCIFINQSPAGEAQLARLKEDFHTSEEFAGRQTITFDASVNITDKLYSDASIIVLQSLVSMDTADVMITQQEILEQFHGQNIYLNLEEVLSEELLGQITEALYYEAGPDGKDIPVGIYLKNSFLVSAYGLDGDSLLCACTLENHPWVIEDFVRFAFQLPLRGEPDTAKGQ